MNHGHKKSQKKKTQQQIKQQNQLSEKISVKLAEFFAIRKQPIVDNKIPTLMEFTAILMQLCSDITTIFNYRRELIQKLLQNQSVQGKAKTLGTQIKLITKIIQSNPKSYTLWTHRQWLVVKLYQIDKSIIDKQRQLCSMLLLKDEKNFHVWNYRNWANHILMNIDNQLQYTKAKINSNPFNFSAYHFRSKYLIEKYSKERQQGTVTYNNEIIIYGMPKQIFNNQLETVKTAIFLNPKQQAPWLYYSWLLKQLLPALLLDIQQSQDNSFDITFSIKTNNPKNIIQVEGKQFQVISSHHIPSNKWKIIFKQPVDINQINLRSNSSQIALQNQLGGRKLIWTKQQNTSQIIQIYEAQQTFLKEVIQTEQNRCRFGWLQLLDLYKSWLYLGITNQKWQQISQKALQIFSNLSNECKGQKYIEKLKNDWQRLADQSNLSEIQKKLKQYTK